MRVRRTEPAFSILTALAILAACARIEPPPGGPPDTEPPRLIATRPDTTKRVWPFKGAAEFQFDEVISEGGTPNRGEGTGGLERLVILSPSNQVPEVDWRRNRITVRPREGWKPNRVYRVELLPGVTDLRNNPSHSGAVLTFSTGGPRPQATLQGEIIDWSTSRPVPRALVIATLLPDSLPYRGVADSSGRFSLGPLPVADYSVVGVIDQNSDHRQDTREAYATARINRGQKEVGELWAFVHDTTPARIQNITVNDSVSATVTFSQKLDPRQRLTARDIRLRLLPDSTPFPVLSLLPQPVDDSLHVPRAPRDTTQRDTLADTTRARPGLRGPRVEEVKKSRPPLFDRLVLRVPRPWPYGARLVLDARGVRNVTGVAADVNGVVVAPEKPKPVAKDTTKGRQVPDTTAVRKPPPKPQTPPKPQAPPKPQSR